MTDRDAPARRAQVGTHTPVLSGDGSDIGAAIQTIVEVGDGATLAKTIADAFDGATLSVGDSFQCSPVNSTAEVTNPIAGFEPLLQAPARLQVTAVLAQAQEAEFSRLKEVTGTSDSVMSKHLGALAEAGFIKLCKGATTGRQRTWASLTRAGRRTFNDHVAALQRIVTGG